MRSFSSNEAKKGAFLNQINYAPPQSYFFKKLYEIQRSNESLTIYAGSSIDDKMHVVLKEIRNIFSANLQTLKGILRELYFLKNFDHPNIVGLLQVENNMHKENGNLTFVLEYMDVDLEKYLMNKETLEIDEIAWIMFETLKGLEYIHSHSCIHRDIKPSNILINEQGKVKICDLTSTRSIVKRRHAKAAGPSSTTLTLKSLLSNIENLENLMKKEIYEDLFEDVEDLIESEIRRDNKISAYYEYEKRGAAEIGKNGPSMWEENHCYTRPLTRKTTTRWYRAPEIILLNGNYDDKVDIWSLGCLFAELLGKTEKLFSAITC
jgi:mitogen-activated protein kinase 1/3